MSEIAELRERILAATGPDRELDAAVTAHLRVVPDKFANETWAMHWTGPFVAKGERVHLAHSDGRLGVWFLATPITASIDAAVALVRQRLPQWTTDVHTADASSADYPVVLSMGTDGEGSADCEISYQHPKMEARLIGEGWGPTLPLAVVRALLDALCPA